MGKELRPGNSLNDYKLHEKINNIQIVLQQRRMRLLFCKRAAGSYL
jgi:hypothetical protein